MSLFFGCGVRIEDYKRTPVPFVMPSIPSTQENKGKTPNQPSGAKPTIKIFEAVLQVADQGITKHNGNDAVIAVRKWQREVSTVLIQRFQAILPGYWLRYRCNGYTNIDVTASEDAAVKHNFMCWGEAFPGTKTIVETMDITTHYSILPRVIYLF